MFTIDCTRVGRDVKVIYGVREDDLIWECELEDISLDDCDLCCNCKGVCSDCAIQIASWLDIHIVHNGQFSHFGVNIETSINLTDTIFVVSYDPKWTSRLSVSWVGHTSDDDRHLLRCLNHLRGLDDDYVVLDRTAADVVWRCANAIAQHLRWPQDDSFRYIDIDVAASWDGTGRYEDELVFGVGA